MANNPASVWAQIEGSMPPLIPKPEPPPVWAPVPAGQEAEPVQGLPSAPAVAPPPEQQELDHDRSSLAQLQQPKTPWADLGVGGKIKRVFSVAGNAAGDVADPAAMARIPGTDLNRRMQEQQLSGRVNAEERGLSENEGRDAQTEHTREQTREMPAAQESQNALRGAQTENLESEAEQRRVPDLAHAYAHAVGSAMAAGRDPGTDPVVQHLADAITAIQRQPLQKGMEHVAVVGPGGKPVPANYHPDTGTYTDATGKAIPNPQLYEKPNQSGEVTVIAPDPNTPGGGIVERVGAGAHLAPGSQTASQFGSVNTPTSQMRTAGARAQLAASEIPGIVQEVQDLRGQLGPVAGRWNDFMQGKVGADNPQLAGLRSDLTFLSSAVALAHAVGRLPENLREEFDTMINAPHQNPDNIIAVLGHVQKWMNDNAQAMGGMRPTGNAPKEERKAMLNGKRIEVRAGKWVYSDTGKAVQ